MQSVRRKWSFVMVVGGLCLLTLLPGGCRREAADTSDPDAIDTGQIPEFSEEVQAVLKRRIEFVEQLAAQKTLVDVVQKANRESESISDREIQRRDKEWQEAEALDGRVRSLMTNECAGLLADFQDSHRGFPEIFVTDARGLIVATTNRTTDYLQSDESWWQKAFNEEKGQSHYGELEYDTSAFSESISLNVPVVDPDSGKAIGVVKAVCDVTAIKMEL
jgi:hypothetical protein